ncbi:Ldh family oxidoreductase [Leucobacter weissii]|uniref:Ldh family oxidoreductase n=1 Tax=Leucobacter weissii TaxID=1983706 RepID=A0A939MN18_9MICO|nr:Ldh family oxidoreductase [Leucobacter weissii]MBO1901582.1 Ldh family oxidoreductase [Leucobacter weissii]
MSENEPQSAGHDARDDAGRISFDALVEAIGSTLIAAGASPPVAAILARNCASCERDGALSHGVFRVPGYVRSLSSGWANGAAEPVVQRAGASFIRVDAADGFSQPALIAAEQEIAEAIGETGVAVVAIRDSHHFSALWPDLEPFAADGLLGLTMVTGGASVIPRGARREVLGTNPFAFASPVAGGRPLVMDFATSTMSHGDLQLTAEAGRKVHLGTGTGRGGRDTDDPREILDEGGLLPFGGHKGLALSLMVEILASGLTGSAFSYQDDLVFAESPEDGGTARTGQLLILIDPDRGAGGFAGRVAEFIAALREAGLERLPADHRYRARAEAGRTGIPVTPAIRELLAAAVSPRG